VTLAEAARPGRMAGRRWITAASGGLLLAVVSVAITGLSPSNALLATFAVVVSAGLFVAPGLSIGILAVFLLLQQFLTNVVGGPDTDIGRVVHQLDKYILVAGVVRVTLALMASRPHDPIRRWTAWTAAFCAIGLLSGLVHAVPLRTLFLGAFLGVKFPLFVLIGLAIPWKPDDAERIVRWVIRLGPLLLASGILLLLAPDGIRALFTDPAAASEDFFRRGGVESMRGIFTHPGTFGWAMSLVACYAFASVLQRRKAGAVTGLVAGIIGILWSLRRKPLVALPLAVLSGIVTLRTRRQRAGVVVALVVVGTAGWLVGRHQLAIVSQATAAEYLNPDAESDLPRLVLYGVGWRVATASFPLGAGFGRFGSYASVLDYSPLYDQYGLSSLFGFSPDDPRYVTDAYWPSVVGETGFLGAAVCMGFIVALWFGLRRAARMSAAAESNRLLAQAAGFALVEVLVESVAGPLFATSLTAFAVAVPIGVSLRLASPLPEEPQPSGPGEATPRAAPRQDPPPLH